MRIQALAGLKAEGSSCCRVRDEISDLSERYSAALSEHETSNAVVQVWLCSALLLSTIPVQATKVLRDWCLRDCAF